jgi:hypothetical protein
LPATALIDEIRALGASDYGYAHHRRDLLAARLAVLLDARVACPVCFGVFDSVRARAIHEFSCRRKWGNDA